jgi:ankyrin repeat protein
MSSENGHTEIVRLLLNDPRVDPKANDNHAIRISSKNGHTEVVRLLLNDPRVDPSANNNTAIRLSSKNGHTEVFLMLLNDPRVDPTTFNHIGIVRMLLNDPRVDPSTDGNYTIIWSSQYGHTEVVRMLLNDPRVDPSVNNNLAIIYASQNGNTEIVQLLLNARIKNKFYIYYALLLSINSGKTNVTRIILNDPRIKAYLNESVETFMYFGDLYKNFIRLLLNDSQIDPKFDNLELLKFFAKNGARDEMKLLLDDPRLDISQLDPTDSYNTLIIAIKNNNSNIVELLLEHIVDPTYYGYHALDYASELGFHEIVSLLENDDRVQNMLAPEMEEEFDYEYEEYEEEEKYEQLVQSVLQDVTHDPPCI